MTRPTEGQLQRPKPPSIRVLETLIVGQKPPVKRFDNALRTSLPGSASAVVKKPVKKAGPKRKEKVTAEMRRKARQAREVVRDEKAASERRDREEIFEVGEEGMDLQELGELIQVDPSEIVRTLFMKGIMLSMNQVRSCMGARNCITCGLAWVVHVHQGKMLTWHGHALGVRQAWCR